MKSGVRSQKPEARSQKLGFRIFTPKAFGAGNPESNIPSTPLRAGQHRVSSIRHPVSPSPGFTLIEIMVVIVIIMILMGIVIGTAKYAQTKAARSRAQAEIAVMEAALEQYKNDNGVYPISLGASRLDVKPNCASLYVALTTPKVYMTFKPNQLRTEAGITYILDPFGSPYNYYCTQPVAGTQKNQTTFDLWSYGPDGQDSTADDITNWQQN